MKNHALRGKRSLSLISLSHNFGDVPTKWEKEKSKCRVSAVQPDISLNSFALSIAHRRIKLNLPARIPPLIRNRLLILGIVGFRLTAQLNNYFTLCEELGHLCPVAILSLPLAVIYEKDKVTHCEYTNDCY